ncbi:non-ribosomal peptide synthetase [Francisella sp. SYW-9]|uniref:non-ribosomal peptide synthetase n=1 Tax=Francisella sp. SYW-9 TaxID=2610888 RepID=UPI00123C8F81|nr:non-ribosomal peptide synthetase [Francisella sp. SYW-9]
MTNRNFYELHKSFLSYGDKLAICRLKDKNVIQSITYNQLYNKVCNSYQNICNFEIKTKNVCVLTTDIINFTSALIALILAGNTVTIYEKITDQESLDNYCDKLKERVADSKSSVLICDDTDVSKFTKIDCQLISFKELNRQVELPVEIKKESGTLIQYSSGSTSLPKGIILSEESILKNINESRDIWNVLPKDNCLLWSKYSHLYGLATSLLLPLSIGSSLYQVDTDEILANPSYLVEIISKYKINFLGALNFIYDLCTNYTGDDLDIDLSSLRVAVVAGEIVKKKTLIEFYKKFKHKGFLFESFCPSYGMTEMAGFISATSPASMIESDESYNASVGKPLQSKEVLIIDDNNKVCSEGEPGEIVVIGGFIGYNKSSLNMDDLFYIEPSTSKKFFRTGDIGYIKNNQIYIASRKKEVIVQNGKKHYPIDIENISCDAHRGFDKYVVAFSYLDNDLTERIVIVQSVKDIKANEVSFLVNKVRRDIYNKMLINIDDIVFIKSLDFPLSKMGKILRKKVQEKYLSKRLDLIKSHKVKRYKDINSKYLPIVDIWKNILKVDTICSENADFFELGGSSLRALELIIEVEKTLNKKITIKEFMKNSKISSLYRLLSIKQLVEDASSNNEFLVENELKDFQVTSVQQGLISFYEEYINNFYAMGIFDIYSDSFSPEDIYNSTKYVIAKNLSMQLKVYKKDNKFFQTKKSDIYDFKFDFYDFDEMEQSQKIIEIKKRTSKLTKFNIFGGTTVAIGYYKNFDSLGHSLIVFNGPHIFFDAHSIDLFYNQMFEYLYTNIRNNELDTSLYKYSLIMDKLEKASIESKRNSYLQWKKEITNGEFLFSTLMKHSYDLNNSDRAEKLINFKLNISKANINIEHALFISFVKAVYQVFNIDINKNIAFHLTYNHRNIPAFEIGETFYSTMGAFNGSVPVCVNFNEVSSKDTTRSREHINEIVSKGRDFSLLRKYIFKNPADERKLFKTMFNVFSSEKAHEKSNFVKGDRSRDIWGKSLISYNDMCKIKYLLEYHAIVFDDMLQIQIHYSKYHYTEDVLMKLTDKMIENFYKLTN